MVQVFLRTERGTKALELPQTTSMAAVKRRMLTSLCECEGAGADAGKPRADVEAGVARLWYDSYLVCCSRALSEAATLAESNVVDGTTIELRVRVRGGGGGASKPKKSTEPPAAAASAPAPAPAPPAADAAPGGGQETVAALRARLQEAESKLAESEGARQEEARKGAEAERKLAELLTDKEKMDARASTAADDTSSDDQKLKLEASAVLLQFNKFADAQDGKGEQRMSRAGLQSALAALNLWREVDQVMDRFDMNRDGWIDFAEFQLIVARDPELEMLVRSFGIERIIAAKLKKGDSDEPLAGFSDMTDKEVEDAVASAVPLIVANLKSNVKKAKDAQRATAQVTSTSGAKFSNPLKGGDIDFYYKGVTSVVGEPYADIEKGVEEEHTKLNGCDKPFSTGNYGVTSNPKLEYNAVTKGQKGEVSGTWRANLPGGAAQKDERELRPLEDYGDFRPDGTLAVSPGDKVVVGEDLKSSPFEEEEEDYEGEDDDDWVKQGAEGTVIEIREDGAVAVDFEGKTRWVQEADVGKLHPQPREDDSPVQRLVKEAKLTRVEVRVLVLYTGPMFVLYNSILRGFGACGAVPKDVEFGSDRFWEAIKAETVEDRMKGAGHKFASTLHVLASAVKKLQKVSTSGQGTRLYRGLGGLDIRDFLKSLGFAEKGFMSATENMDVALEYSGAKQGLVGTVLAMDLSAADKGAALELFSQYPSEKDTIFNACSYVEALRGKDEIRLTQWGPVRVVMVKVNANGRAETVEELVARRKGVVLELLHTLERVVGEDMDHIAETDEFEQRVAQERQKGYRDRFIASIKNEAARRVGVYEGKPPAFFTDNDNLGKAVNDALDLPLLARGKLQLWLQDASINLEDVGHERVPLYIDFQKVRGRATARRRKELRAAEEKGDREALKRAAVEECVQRRLITSEEALDALDTLDELSKETPLFTRSTEGDAEATKLLCQAGANVNFQLQDDGSETALHRCIATGFLEVCEVLISQLVDRNASLDIQDAYGRTPLHQAAEEGHADVMPALLGAGAAVDPRNIFGWSPLFLAAEHGRAEAAAALLQAGADPNAKDVRGETPLDRVCDYYRGDDKAEKKKELEAMLREAMLRAAGARE